VVVACAALTFSFAERAAAAAPPAAAPPHPPAAASHPRTGKATGGALRVQPVRPVPAGDEIVTGRGDPAGWHLYAASSGGGWAWQPLASLAPAGLDANGERWIGRQCLTGDGRFVVAVVAPWSADNTPAGADRGGVAYTVDAHTGAVRPLVSGVSLYYFTPSCGAGSSVALTRYVGADETATQLVLADAASATLRSVRTLAGQYTAGVPDASGGFFAASGGAIVHLPRSGAATRTPTAGQPFDLVATASGGVDFLLGRDHRTATVWSLGSAGARQIGAGRFRDLALFQGRGGHPIATGTTTLDRTAGASAVTGRPAVEAVSLDGTAYSPAPTATAAPADAGSLPRIPLLLGRGTGPPSSWQPATTAPSTVALPPVLRDNGTVVDPRGVVTGPAPGHARAAASPPAGFTSTCAVGRNDVHLQAMQPSPEDVAWAANLAGRSLLTGSAARGPDFANLGLPAYSPSLDFPLPGPFGPGGASIPRELLEGIVAQESNFKQASWHSVQGVAGNPLIADYYGAGGGYVVGVQEPDCGYGLGQITTGMHTGEMSYDRQRKVAVDYAENLAAAAQILAQKWNELAAAGITANDADPGTLENWYLALWDYNSGLHPASGSGPWGLGWFNNPANPDYPYNRGPFLHADTPLGVQITYQDAATPGNWPYEEKVFGWMEVPIESTLTGKASYTGTIVSYDPGSNTNVPTAGAFELSRPGMADFCALAANQCDPTVCSRATYDTNCDPATSDGTGPCTRADFECWWHLPVSWCNLLDRCHSGTWEYGPGNAEPPAQSAAYYPLPTCAVSASDITAGTDIVDSQAASVNLQGCTAANQNWRNRGSFAFSYGDPSVPGSQRTDLDLHQLGTGLGGHMWFTHTDEPTDSRGVPLWGVTGTWTPQLARGRYQVKAYVPAAGATATEADYTIDNGLGFHRTVTVNQNAYGDQWVSLGYFWLGPGSSVSLTNLHITSDGDLAFSGMAFVPAVDGTYAMLGDSYSAGEGAGTYDADTKSRSTPAGTNNGHRSPYSYNRVFAAGTTTFADPNTWTDVACSGALIPDFYAANPNGRCPNEPGQHTTLNANTSLLTLTFGGNDLGFTPILTDCVSRGLDQAITGAPIHDAPTCEAKDSDRFQADLARLTDPADSGGWPQLFDQIRAEAPNADVVVLGYPHLFVGTTPGSSGRCWRDGFILDSDQDWLNGVADQIDAALQRAATQAGFGYLSTTAAFTGHELCSADPWFTGIFDPTQNDTPRGVLDYLSSALGTDRQQWFHPNIAGYAEEAAMLTAAVQVP
jgi:hypothetical protein